MEIDIEKLDIGNGLLVFDQAYIKIVPSQSIAMRLKMEPFTAIPGIVVFFFPLLFALS